MKIENVLFKIAAQVCRKRKTNSIESLNKKVENMKKKKATLETEHLKLKEEVLVLYF
jgi:hypothetical protein